MEVLGELLTERALFMFSGYMGEDVGGSPADGHNSGCCYISPC